MPGAAPAPSSSSWPPNLAVEKSGGPQLFLRPPGNGMLHSILATSLRSQQDSHAYAPELVIIMLHPSQRPKAKSYTS